MENVKETLFLLLVSGKHLSTISLYFSSVVKTVPPVGSSLNSAGLPFIYACDSEGGRCQHYFKAACNQQDYHHCLRFFPMEGNLPHSSHGTPESSLLAPLHIAPSTSCCHQSIALGLHKAPSLGLVAPGLFHNPTVSKLSKALFYHSYFRRSRG